MKDKYSQDIQNEALRIVDSERTQWEDAVCYVTEKVGFRMRELIRTLRKNYWGVFDEPKDPLSGRNKVWQHLVMKIVEDYRKNINMGRKDITFRARTANGYAITDLTRAVVYDYLDKMYFNETMDETDLQLCIDGTVVWKTWESVDDNGKVKLNRRTVDLLNLYIDPTEENIQSAYRFTERALLLPDQIKGMTGWFNTDVTGKAGLSKIDPKTGTKQTTTGKFVDVWEMHGKIPAWICPAHPAFGNKNHKDAFKEVDGKIIVSGLESNEKRVHLLEANTKRDKLGNIIKSYEEVRDTKVSGRWYGLGRAERVLALQEYLNTVVNIRINRNYISQLGLFKIKKNSGITAQLLKKLPANGAIPVNDMGDIEQFQVQGVDQTSYRDEEVIKQWSEDITSAHSVASGSDAGATQTATATAITNTNAKTSFVLTKEAKANFYERWMDRHALPIIAKTVTVGDVIRIAGDDERLDALIERIVSYHAQEPLEELYSQGVYPSPEEIMLTLEQSREELKNREDLLIDMLQDIIADSVDTKVRFSNEDLDTTVTVQNLISMLPIVPEYKNDMVKQIFDLLGLAQPKLQPAMMPQQGMQEEPTDSIQEEVTNANVPSF